MKLKAKFNFTVESKTKKELKKYRSNLKNKIKGQIAIFLLNNKIENNFTF